MSGVCGTRHASCTYSFWVGVTIRQTGVERLGKALGSDLSPWWGYEVIIIVYNTVVYLFFTGLFAYSLYAYSIFEVMMIGPMTGLNVILFGLGAYLALNSGDPLYMA